MFKTLFGKLMRTYFIIIAITLIMLGFSLSQILHNYYFSQKQKQLIDEGMKINDMVVQYTLGAIDEQRFYQEIDAIDRFLNAKIWFVDRVGIIWASSSGTDGSWEGQKLTKKEFKQVMEGDIITKIGRFSQRFTVPMITVGVPLSINGRINGAIFLHSPVYEVNNTLKNVYKMIWVSALISLVIAILMLYFTSKRISKPLKEMSTIAKDMSKGRFDKKVSIYSDDEIGQLSQSFNYMARELENLENMRKSFVENVSHELKSPLTSINGFIEGMIDGTIPREEFDKYLGLVSKEIKRLSKMTKELLELSQLENPSMVIKPSPFDINELIRKVIINHEAILKEKDIDIDVRFDEHNLWVVGDEEKILQVLNNLLDNAIRFVDAGGRISFITLCDDDKAYISIQDNGCGIPEGEIKYIWDRFYKVDKARTYDKTGTGLGLSIVKNIIKQHNQEIWVKSQPGKGTKFTFTLKKYGEKP
ncbi:MAG TPA: cell wall metabolism sensor histidine kinase WalK [Clostridiales bacterium]|nr:cell wall metabolism sensor histidine kinase WalK [Clostridiales bacterium]